MRTTRKREKIFSKKAEVAEYQQTAMWTTRKREKIFFKKGRGG
jgi:hypothetical protein